MEKDSSHLVHEGFPGEVGHRFQLFDEEKQISGMFERQKQSVKSNARQNRNNLILLASIPRRSGAVKGAVCRMLAIY